MALSISMIPSRRSLAGWFLGATREACERLYHHKTIAALKRFVKDSFLYNHIERAFGRLSRNIPSIKKDDLFPDKIQKTMAWIIQAVGKNNTDYVATFFVGIKNARKDCTPHLKKGAGQGLTRLAHEKRFETYLAMAKTLVYYAGSSDFVKAEHLSLAADWAVKKEDRPAMLHVLSIVVAAASPELAAAVKTSTDKMEGYVGTTKAYLNFMDLFGRSGTASAAQIVRDDAAP